MQIPTTEETVRDFGKVRTRFQKQYAGASASAIYDVLNDVILDSVLCPYKTAEREMAEELFSSVLSDEKKKKQSWFWTEVIHLITFWSISMKTRFIMSYVSKNK